MDIGFPRQRFLRPVRVAIFGYGRAPADVPVQQNDPDDEGAPPSVPKGHRHNAELWFEGISNDQAPREIRSLVARLHVNMGHPRTADFVRHVVGCGASPATLRAAAALRCASCTRKGKLRPQASPAKIPKIGAFNTKIEFDMFYWIGGDGTARRMLGIIRTSTRYHVATFVPHFDAASVFNTLFRSSLFCLLSRTSHWNVLLNSSSRLSSAWMIFSMVGGGGGGT